MPTAVLFRASRPFGLLGMMTLTLVRAEALNPKAGWGHSPPPGTYGGLRH